jgi:hypothetical protein
MREAGLLPQLKEALQTARDVALTCTREHVAGKGRPRHVPPLREWDDPVLYTSGLLGIPALIHLARGSKERAALVGALATSSVMHHRSREANNVWSAVDHTLAAAFFLMNVHRVLQFDSARERALNAALLSVSLVPYVAARYADYIGRDEDYERLHTLWHYVIAAGGVYGAVVW